MKSVVKSKMLAMKVVVLGIFAFAQKMFPGSFTQILQFLTQKGRGTSIYVVSYWYYQYIRAIVYARCVTLCTYVCGFLISCEESER